MNKILMILIGFLLIMSSVYASSYYDLPDKNMQSWYDFNNATGSILNDLKGSADGINSNTQQGQDGKIGYSYYYDGTDSFTVLGDSLMRDGNFSFSFWFKAGAQNQNPGFILGRSGGNLTDTSYTIGYYNQYIYFEMYSPGGSGATASVTGVTEGNWHLVVVSYNSDTNILRINVDNGAKSGVSTALAGGPYFGSQNSYFGRDYRTTYKYKGNIDEFAYWTEYLSDTDINNLWNGGAGVTYYSDAIDYTVPTMGQTTITDFTYYGSVINGTGNIVGGMVSQEYDYNKGSNWTDLKTDVDINYVAISTSDNGKYIYTVGTPGFIYDSNDYGVTWRSSDVNRTTWTDIKTSSDGKYVAAVANGTKIFISDTYASTWTEYDSNRSWSAISVSETGQYMTATVNNGYIYDSNDYGQTWTQRGILAGWMDVAISKNGQYQYAVSGIKSVTSESCTASGHSLYYSTDYGVTWTQSSLDDCFSSVATNETGKYVVAATTSTFPYNGLVYYSSTFGDSWNISSYSPTLNTFINDISMTNDGRYVLFVNILYSGSRAGNIYSSNNFGADFNFMVWANDNINQPLSITMSDDKYSYTGTSLTAIADGSVRVSVRDKRGIDTNSCEFTDNNGTSWSPASWNGYTCVFNDYVTSQGQSYIFNTRVKNWTGTQGTGLATIRYTATEGSIIQFIVRDKIGTAIPNSDINIYTINPDSSRTIFSNITTDSTGSAYAILKSGTTYSLDIYYNGVYTATQQTLISSITPIYITINTTPGGIDLPDINNVYITWTPNIDFVYSDVTSFVQKVTSNNVKDFNILIYQYQDYNTSDINVRYNAAGACNKECTITTLLSGFTYNENKPFYIDLNLGLDDGTRRVSTHKYVRPSSSTMPAVLDLIRNAKTDWDCSKDSNLPCGPTIIISIVLTILALASIVILTNYTGPQGLAIIALGILGILTYVEWFYWVAYFIIVVVTILYVGKGAVE